MYINFVDFSSDYCGTNHLPGSRAYGIPRGAQDRDEGPMPSGAVSRAGDDYARLFSPQTTGPGGGTGS